ncbi:MAG: DUF6364 family protein [Cyclobacterium sp.]|uniref:DUF6364 family protein n=1 Tax=Cyclobacterium sp. TaxID=1966343 RepID=UPI003970EA0F
MNTKLTLNLKKSVIEKAKAYSKTHKKSLSKLIESYLSTLTDSNDEDPEISPLVKSLSGIIELDGDFNYKEAYSDYLLNKYK